MNGPVIGVVGTALLLAYLYNEQQKLRDDVAQMERFLLSDQKSASQSSATLAQPVNHNNVANDFDDTRFGRRPDGTGAPSRGEVHRGQPPAVATDASQGHTPPPATSMYDHAESIADSLDDEPLLNRR
jgi:hypothetical protein